MNTQIVCWAMGVRAHVGRNLAYPTLGLPVEFEKIAESAPSPSDEECGLQLPGES